MPHDARDQGADQQFDDLPDEDYGYDEEELGLKEAFGLPDRLPALRLPSERDLAATARGCSAIGRAKALADWVGESREITLDGDLTVEEARSAAKTLGIALPETFDDSRSSSELRHLWSLTLELTFVQLAGTHATRDDYADTWPGGEDDDVLDTWTAALAYVVSHSLQADADEAEEYDLDFSGAGASLLIVLFVTRGDGVDVAELREMTREGATANLDEADAAAVWERWVGAHGHPADVLLARLAEVDAAEVVDDVARLTPLGLWSMREQLVADGVHIPLVPPAEEMTAEHLVDAGADFSEDELVAEASAWLALRDPAAAAAELLALAATGRAAHRLIATSVVGMIGEPAIGHLRQSLGDLLVGPHAKLALARLAAGESEQWQLTERDLASLVVDRVTATATTDGAEGFAADLAEAIPAGQVEIFEHLWRLDHPQAHEALTLIGEYHPDRRTAKAARKAAFQCQSAGARRG